MKFIFSEKAHTIIIIVVGLLLFFHPHFGPPPPSRIADCSKRDGKDREIMLTVAGRRKFLVLRVCDTLTIVNGDREPFHPAPGPHPFHGSYPELDPRRVLAPGERFQATLVRTGNYQLHNDATEKILADLTILGWVR